MRVAWLTVALLVGCDAPCDYDNPKCARGKVCLFGAKRDARCLDYVESTLEVERAGRVFDNCADERASGPDAKNSTHCGLGYGNQVKIWDAKSGYIFFFAHLARVIAKRGPVKRGDVLGVTGVSGLAGGRHVHFTVTSASSGLERALETEGWKGDRPVRYRFRARADLLAAPDEMPCSQDPAQRPTFTR